MYPPQFILYRQHILIFNPLPIYPTIVQPITTLPITINPSLSPSSNNIKNQLKTPGNTRLDSLHFQKTIHPNPSSPTQTNLPNSNPWNLAALPRDGYSQECTIPSESPSPPPFPSSRRFFSTEFSPA